MTVELQFRLFLWRSYRAFNHLLSLFCLSTSTTTQEAIGVNSPLVLFVPLCVPRLPRGISCFGSIGDMDIRVELALSLRTVKTMSSFWCSGWFTCGRTDVKNKRKSKLESSIIQPKDSQGTPNWMKEKNTECLLYTRKADCGQFAPYGPIPYSCFRHFSNKGHGFAIAHQAEGC